MALTITIAVFDLAVTEPVADAASLATWKGTLTITHVYGWDVVALSNTKLRYTIAYD